MGRTSITVPVRNLDLNAQIHSMSISRDNRNKVIRVVIDQSSAIQITYLMNKDMGSPNIELKNIN